MKFANFSTKGALFLGLTLLALSCKKVNVPDEMGDAGQTIVKLMTDDGEFRMRAIDLVNTPQVVKVLDVRRDVPNGAELNKTMTVSITEDPAIVTRYNTVHGTTYEALPADKYTIDPANPRTGNQWTLTMTPGEFAKGVFITVPNSLLIDLTKTYAFGFKLSAVDQNGRIAFEADTAVVEIGVKNDWDGIYTVNGEAWRNDPASPLQGPWGPVERILATAGPTTVQWEGSVPWANGSGSALPGGYEPTITVDPVTNKVTLGSPGNVITADPTYDNRYDPATKTFYFRFYWGAGPGSRLQTIAAKYKGPR